MKTISKVIGFVRIGFFKRLLILLLAFVLTPSAWCDVAVNSIGNHRTVCIRFPRSVMGTSASNFANYSVNGGDITVTNVIILPDQQSVELFLDAPVGEFFSIGISNIVDVLTNSINTIVTGYVSDYTSSVMGAPGDPPSPGHVFTALKDSFQVTASGSDIGGNSDHGHFIHQTVIGDFDMAVLVTRLDLVNPDSKAGLMVRENLSPGSRMLATLFTPTQGTALLENSFRQTTNGNTSFFGPPGFSSEPLRWLRITRSNDVFTAYESIDGSSWNMTGFISFQLPMSLEVGMAVSSHDFVQATTAEFTSFGVWGERPGDKILPVLGISYYQTNIILKWQRTPRDYTVQITTNLIPDDPQGQGTNETTQWSMLLQPVFDTSLTGTNEMMPTPGRYMVVPRNIIPNAKTLFMRLTKVHRVIPDPIYVTPGIILSQAGGNLMSVPTSATLCGDMVDTSTALAQCTIPLICPKGHVYEFTTTPSGSTLQTVLQVRNYPAVGTTSCDGTFSAGGGKAQVTVTNLTQTGYTFIVAATPAVIPSLTNPLKVQINIR